MNVPLSLYIHFPWCIRKCPYCDFNSHKLQNELPEAQYIDTLIDDFCSVKEYAQDRPIEAIFMGGGTPSLFSATAIGELLEALKQVTTIAPNAEITLEANPGAIEAQRFSGYHHVGLNRLSIGVQSFEDEKLQRLGRIHDATQAQLAIQMVNAAGFDNYNIDLMYGLPSQSLEAALIDLQKAINLNAPHISWYQLTLEPNTVFYSKPPKLPSSDDIYEIEVQGRALLKKHGYIHYEVSAYAKPNFECQHNKNYWTFGDYIGIGAGAHSKVTHLKDGTIFRYQNTRQPKDYLDKSKPFIARRETIKLEHINFEFMLNALRLQHNIPLGLYTQRTGKSIESLIPVLNHAKQRSLLNWNDEFIGLTPTGHRYLNDVIQLFL